MRMNHLSDRLLEVPIFVSLMLGLLASNMASANSSPAVKNAPVIKKLMLDSVEFSAPCSVKSMTIRGQASELSGQALRNGEAIASGEVKVPVKSIRTGMAVRDEHMRERIFKAADGSYPDLAFKTTQSNCSISSPETTCSVEGLFSIRGIEKPAKFECQSKDSTLNCKSTLKLSDYSIEQPSQLGVKVGNEISVSVRLKVES